MFSPVETSGIWEYFGFTSETEGLSAVVNNPRAIAMPDGREVSRVTASGTISIEM
jgi:hypothetical protein